MTVKLIPVGEFEFPEPGPDMFTLTCVNHQTARYSTKNPFERTLKVLKFPEGDDIERTETGECACPFRDLVVIVGEEGDVE